MWKRRQDPAIWLLILSTLPRPLQVFSSMLKARAVPDLTIATYRFENALGCFAMAAESDRPRSTSIRTCVITLESDLLWVWLARMFSARRMGRPEFTMVANCREKTARSFFFTWP